MAAEVKSNLNWKDRCTKLLEHTGEKNSIAKDVKGKTDILLKEKKELESKLKLIEEQTEIASKQLEELKNGDGDKPISSSLLKLYSLITNITFDIESPANEPKGYIAGNSLETFQFNTGKHSRQFIVESLWNLIEEQLKTNRAKKHPVNEWLLDCEDIKRLKLS